MKTFLKKIISALPWSGKFFVLYRKVKLKFYYGLIKGKKELFSDYYSMNNWGSEESVSGSGSTLSYTESLRTVLPQLFANLNIKSILDAPCGDMNWFSHVLEEYPIEYKGGDIVPALIAQHQQNFNRPNISFFQLDITKDHLPEADMWLCRDCLIHFPNKDIFKALNNYLSSNIPYLLTTSYTESDSNTNIITGLHRYLNLELPPFFFQKPQLYLNDWVEGYPVKKLGLWRREDVEEVFANVHSNF